MTGAPIVGVPPADVAAWRRFLEQLRACLIDDSEPRTALQPLGQAARDAKVWPIRTADDEFLLSGVLRLAWCYGQTGPRRRQVLAPGLFAQLGEAEQLVAAAGGHLPGDPPRGAAPARPTEPRTPEPGEPGYRADVHG